jgi:antitoxin ChpS
MPVEIILRKFGNSTGAVFPQSVLKDMGLKAEQPMTMGTYPDGTITLVPKRKYTLAALIAQFDPKSAAPADMALWDAAPPLGQEIL